MHRGAPGRRISPGQRQRPAVRTVDAVVAASALCLAVWCCYLYLHQAYRESSAASAGSPHFTQGKQRSERTLLRGLALPGWTEEDTAAGSPNNSTRHGAARAAQGPMRDLGAAPAVETTREAWDIAADPPVTDQTPPAPKNELPNEALWRAFFDAAAGWRLADPPALQPADLQRTVSTLHPPLKTYDSQLYPGYRLQHGLAISGVTSTAKANTPAAQPGSAPSNLPNTLPAPAASGAAMGASGGTAGSKPDVPPAAAAPGTAPGTSGSAAIELGVAAAAGLGMASGPCTHPNRGLQGGLFHPSPSGVPGWLGHASAAGAPIGTSGSAAVRPGAFHPNPSGVGGWLSNVAAAPERSAEPPCAAHAGVDKPVDDSREPPLSPATGATSPAPGTGVDAPKAGSSMQARSWLFGGGKVPAAEDSGFQQAAKGEKEVLQRTAQHYRTGGAWVGRLIQHQQLFSVYVHNSLGKQLPGSSVLAGRELPERVNTTNGYAQHSLVQATLALLAAALQDSANQRFVLLSDTSIPLYPPQVLYAQLMSETLSRVDACKDKDQEMDLHRWRQVMETPSLKRSHWRKSSQWWMLQREHAELAVADRHVSEVFHRYCYSNLATGLPLCVSDEHFLPTLLASYGLDEQTDCLGVVHYADWSAKGWHPKTFGPQDLTTQLVTRARNAEHCDVHSTLETADRLFQRTPPRPVRPAAAAVAGTATTTATAVGQWRFASWAVDRGFQPLPHSCPLLARKFPGSSSNSTLEFALSCNGLAMGSWCRGGGWVSAT